MVSVVNVVVLSDFMCSCMSVLLCVSMVDSWLRNVV